LCGRETLLQFTMITGELTFVFVLIMRRYTEEGLTAERADRFSRTAVALYRAKSLHCIMVVSLSMPSRHEPSL
jgi:hypothetical protein